MLLYELVPKFYERSDRGWRRIKLSDLVLVYDRPVSIVFGIERCTFELFVKRYNINKIHNCLKL